MTTQRIDPRRGEVWRVDFAPSVGQEQQKVRPAIVVSSANAGRLELRIVVPVTSHKPGREELAWLVPLEPSSVNGLSLPGHADAFQVKSLSLERFGHKLGNLSEGDLKDVVAAVAFCVGYS